MFIHNMYEFNQCLHLLQPLPPHLQWLLLLLQAQGFLPHTRHPALQAQGLLRQILQGLTAIPTIQFPQLQFPTTQQGLVQGGRNTLPA